MLPNKEDIAKQVGIGAVIYANLCNSRIKDIDFSFDRALDFIGETGPYVQYTHVRCCSVLRRAEKLSLPAADYTALTDDISHTVLLQISRFPHVIREAAAKYEPFIITRAVSELCHAYNLFYRENRILDDTPAVSAARVQLTQAVKHLIKRGLYLIGMEAPEQM